jgi:hypothetical protein
VDSARRHTEHALQRRALHTTPIRGTTASASWPVGRAPARRRAHREPGGPLFLPGASSLGSRSATARVRATRRKEEPSRRGKVCTEADLFIFWPDQVASPMTRMTAACQPVRQCGRGAGGPRAAGALPPPPPHSVRLLMVAAPLLPARTLRRWRIWAGCVPAAAMAGKPH